MSRQKEHWYQTTLKAMLASGDIDRREFLRQSALLGTSAAAAYALAGMAGGPARAQSMPQGGTIRITQRCYDLESPHSFKNVEASNVARQVYDYLTHTGTDNVTRPSLCQKWEANADLRTWTLHLRRDVKFHNGRPLTADDVVWNLKRVLDPKTGSSVLGLMKPFLVEEYETGEVDAKGKKKRASRIWDANAIEKVDSHTVRLNGKTPQLAVPEYLFHYPLVIMDPEQNGIMKVGAANGTGAFELVEANVGKRHALKARKGYWNGGPHIDRLEFIDFGDDQPSQMLALASKQAEGVFQADPTMVNSFKGLTHAQMYTVVTSSTGMVRMRPDAKPFSDLRVRQALRHASDTKQLLQTVLTGLGSPGEHIHAGAMHPDYALMPEFPYDVEKAKRLLADAGYPNGIDLEMTIKNVPWERVTCEAIVDQWSKAGIRCKLKVVPTTLYWEGWLSLPFGFTTWSHRPLGVMLFALAYRTGAGWNETGWSNAEFDRLLDEAERTLDIEKRKTIMRRLQEIMQSDGPLMVPFWKANVTFMDKRVLGYEYHPTNYIFGNRLALSA